MTTDPKTIAVYDARAEDYANLAPADTDRPALNAFIALLPAGGRVLDLGCGPAHASAQMRDAGLVPDPVDASAGMVEKANALYDIDARQLTFSDVEMVETYDGIWANFSLLHAPRADLPRHMTALTRALRPSGVFHIGMKTGAGSARDQIDRLYTYVTVSELLDLLAGAGLTVIDTTEGAGTGLDGTVAPFVTMLARKNG